MKVLVTGGRDFTDRDLLFAALDDLPERPSLIIEGGQRTQKNGTYIGGADYWAMMWAQSRAVDCVTVEAEWSNMDVLPLLRRHRRDGSAYNAAAGFIRNQKMIDMRPDKVVAAPGGGGTADCVRRAESAHILVLKIPARPLDTT